MLRSRKRFQRSREEESRGQREKRAQELVQKKKVAEDGKGEGGLELEGRGEAPPNLGLCFGNVDETGTFSVSLPPLFGGVNQQANAADVWAICAQYARRAEPEWASLKISCSHCFTCATKKEGVWEFYSVAVKTTHRKTKIPPD